jgi:hypothetical protein
MSKLGQLMGKVTGTVRQAEHGGRGAGGKTDRDMGGKQGGSPVPPPELPLDDDGNNARNIGG